jgi:hypothetical protein
MWEQDHLVDRPILMAVLGEERGEVLEVEVVQPLEEHQRLDTAVPVLDVLSSPIGAGVGRNANDEAMRR